MTTEPEYLEAVIIATGQPERAIVEPKGPWAYNARSVLWWLLIERECMTIKEIQALYEEPDRRTVVRAWRLIAAKRMTDPWFARWLQNLAAAAEARDEKCLETIGRAEFSRRVREGKAWAEDADRETDLTRANALFAEAMAAAGK